MESCDGTDENSYSALLRCLSQIEWRLFSFPDHPRGQNSHGGGVGGGSSGAYSSAVDELFAFQIVTGCVCDACRRLSVGVQPSYIVTVPLPPAAAAAQPRTTHVDDCVRRFAGTERLDAPARCVRCARDRLAVVVGGRDLVACLHVDAAGIYRRTTHAAAPPPPPPPPGGCQRRSMVRYAPPYLVIQLLRFAGGAAAAKNDAPVAVPRRLSLGNGVVMGAGSDVTYRLFAMCCHLDGGGGGDDVMDGDVADGAVIGGGGHYVTLASGDDVVWHVFDDVTVARVNIDELLRSDDVQRNAYLLFYRAVTS